MSTPAQFAPSALAQTVFGKEVVGRAWSLDRSYDYCEALARGHYENFPVGSVLAPKRLRKHFYSIYAFARTADDFADEGYQDGCEEKERLDLLDQWGAMLKESFAGRARHPIFIALAETQAQFSLPLGLFEDLLSAFTQDVKVRRYSSFEMLLDYCRRSANPVGRLILLLFGHTDRQMHEWSDSICTALQLANHWQDVDIDLAKDRIYLPMDDMARFGIDEEALRRRKVTREFRELLEFEVARTRALFAAGRPLCVSTKGRLGLELRAVWSGGARVLDLLSRNEYDVFSRRPVITLRDKLQILFRSLGKGTFGPR